MPALGIKRTPPAQRRQETLPLACADNLSVQLRVRLANDVAIEFKCTGNGAALVT